MMKGNHKMRALFAAMLLSATVIVFTMATLFGGPLLSMDNSFLGAAIFFALVLLDIMLGVATHAHLVPVLRDIGDWIDMRCSRTE